MVTLIWHAPRHYFSPGDETAFFSWSESISGVISVQGRDGELHVCLRAKRLPAQSLRELIALYLRYRGDLKELAQLANRANCPGFAEPKAYGYSLVFGSAQVA
ncbi:MAG: hypothetical protein JNL84_01035 [Candidatus Accumulibacter sp.]|nr:hypothetical protein [Accumulibacter sp.]